MSLYKEFFHKHIYDDIKYRNIPLNFKIRFEQAFGYYHEKVYTQTKKGKLRDYRTPWILFENTPENARRFAWVFHNFNIYISLNHYREKQVSKECFVDLAFDFDAPELAAAYRDVLAMSRFLENRQVPYQLFFSGKKGFHIVIGYQVFDQEYQENNHLVNKEMAKLLLQETGPLNSLDMAIYSSRRQLRLVNSKHSGSGLFKTPLTLEELAAGPESILKLAKKPRDNFPLADISGRSGYLYHLYLQAKQNLARLPKYDVPEVDLSVLQGSYPPCIDECLKVGIKDGANANRNETTMLLASFFKGQGMDMRSAQDKLINQALGVLRPFSASSDPEIKSSTKTCVASVYRSQKYKFNCQLARGKFKLRCDDTCQLYGKYKDIRRSRKLRYIQVEQPMPQPTYTVEEIREGICEQIDSYLVDPQGKILLIKVPAGVGKTITAMKHLSFGKGRIFWVAGRKDLFANIPYDCQFKWKQILGRHSGSHGDDGEVLVEPNCKYADLAHILGDKNHDINRRLCKGHCDIEIQKCDYFRQFHDRWYHWFVQQPFFFYTRDHFVDPFDVVVIDEDVLEGFKKETQITSDDIEQNYRLFKTLKEEIEADNRFLKDVYAYRGREPEDYIPLNENLNPVVKLLYVISLVAKSNIPFGTSETGKLILDKIRSIAKEKLGEDIEAILKAINDPGVFDKEIKFDLRDESQIPLNFFSSLYAILYFEFFQKHPENNLSRLFFQKQPSTTQQGSVCLESFLLINKLEKHTKKPIIILDATGKKRIYEKLFEREIIQYAPQVKIENEIIQVYTSSNSKRSLSNPAQFNRVMEAVKNLVADEPDTLIISKKIYTERIAAELPDSVKTAHFYGIRGSNEYQNFKQVIIFGTPQIQEEDIKKYASMMHYKESRGVDTSIEYQYRPYMSLVKDGRAPASRVRGFRDPLLQDILETSREDEIIQAINRIRIVHDFAKRVVILSNIPLPALPITDLIEMRELSGELLARNAVKRACRYFLDKFGFVQRKNFIDLSFDDSCLLSPQQQVFLKEHGILYPNASRYERRTITRNFRPIVEEMGLKQFRLNFKNNHSHGYLEIWGRDKGSLERARLMLSNLLINCTFY